MVKRREVLTMPRDQAKLTAIINQVNGCDLIGSQVIEGSIGPVIRERRICPCGEISFEQQSIINTNFPERSVELVGINSNECKL